LVAHHCTVHITPSVAYLQRISNMCACWWFSLLFIRLQLIDDEDMIVSYTWTVLVGYTQFLFLDP